jgi:hypothetical protein
MQKSADFPGTALRAGESYPGSLESGKRVDDLRARSIQ